MDILNPPKPELSMSSAPLGQKLEDMKGLQKMFDEIEGEVEGKQKNPVAIDGLSYRRTFWL